MDSFDFDMKPHYPEVMPEFKMPSHDSYNEHHSHQHKSHKKPSVFHKKHHGNFYNDRYNRDPMRPFKDILDFLTELPID